jgi:tRNA (pseudouridine54-N1)-methyltransferase
MRHFIYYSKTAPTSGNFVKEDLMASGRLDIAIHSIIAAFFLSHSIREDVILHLIFDGPPDAPKHLIFKPVLEGKTGKDKIYLNKKDIGKIIKKMLYKYKENEKTEVFPGYWVEKKSLLSLLKEISSKKLFLLDKKGENIRDLDLDDNSVFIIGDHEGLPNLKKELKKLKIEKLSVGPKTYFASQTITIINNELDLKGL